MLGRGFLQLKTLPASVAPLHVSYTDLPQSPSLCPYNHFEDLLFHTKIFHRFFAMEDITNASEKLVLLYTLFIQSYVIEH